MSMITVRATYILANQALRFFDWDFTKSFEHDFILSQAINIFHLVGDLHPEHNWELGPASESEEETVIRFLIQSISPVMWQRAESQWRMDNPGAAETYDEIVIAAFQARTEWDRIKREESSERV